jgi:hypothetical protein
MPIGGRQWPPIGLAALAAIGAVFLGVVVATRWLPPGDLGDAHAYWLAGQRLLAGEPLYDPTAGPVTPYAYWYPPTFAQVIAPFTVILPAYAFSLLWGVMLLAILAWLTGGRIVVAFAMIAFLPVAIELWFRNVHLVLAALVVLGVRSSPVAFVAGAGIKFAPAVGLAWLAARGRWPSVAVCLAVGAGALAVSYALSPAAWQQYAEILAGRGGLSAATGLVGIPYGIRVVAGLALALVAGRLRPGLGEPLLVVATLLALPTLFPAAFSVLVAAVPLLWLRRDAGAAGSAGAAGNGDAPSGGDGASR